MGVVVPDKDAVIRWAPTQTDGSVEDFMRSEILKISILEVIVVCMAGVSNSRRNDLIS